MGDSGSDTETDDEMIKRRQAPLARRAEASANDAAAHATSATDSRVEAPQPASQAPSSPARTDDDRAAAASGDTKPTPGVESPRRRVGFLSLILNSDDDEPPRFTESTAEPPPSASSRRALSASMNRAAPLIASAPATAQPQAATPAEEQFVSPFASLALLSARGPVPAPPPVTPAPAPAPVPVRATQMPAPAPGPFRTPASSEVPAPPAPNPTQVCAPHAPSTTTTRALSPQSLATTTVDSDGSRSCSLCHEPLQFTPARVGMLCNCCMLTLPLNAFSKNQLRPGHPCRRCSSCTQARDMPAKFKNIRNNVNSLDPNEPRLTKGERARRLRALTSNAAPNTSTSEETREMEVEVRNYKLAKRSILRRRTDNDLRGSTRQDYINQLDEEERKLDAKKDKVRRRNPTLFDELYGVIKVKHALLAREDREDGAAKKQKKAPSPGKVKRKPSTTVDQTEASPSPTSKRARVAPTSAKKTKTTPAKKKTTTTTRVVSSDNDSEYELHGHKIATRARTRQAAKPVVVIDLVDSDSD